VGREEGGAGPRDEWFFIRSFTFFILGQVVGGIWWNLRTGCLALLSCFAGCCILTTAGYICKGYRS